MSAISATRSSPESHWIRVRVRPPSTSLETCRWRVARAALRVAAAGLPGDREVQNYLSVVGAGD